MLGELHCAGEAACASLASISAAAPARKSAALQHVQRGFSVSPSLTFSRTKAFSFIFCAAPQIAAFVRDWRARRQVPLPGQVDVVCGGPPCQGMSGLNRHARKTDVLTDSRCATGFLSDKNMM